MSNYVLLSQAVHQQLKVITERNATYGDNVKYAPTFSLEFRNIQACYPIFFAKNNETGEFFPIALLGFESDENLFLNDSGWDATYIPMMIQRHPFLIGYQASSEDDSEEKPVVSIDMDSPRVSEEHGEALFEDDGQPTQFLKSNMSRLEALHQGHEHNKGFIEALVSAELIESFTLDITLNDGSANQLLGFYTINEEKLNQLDGETLGKLNVQGYLQPIYMAVASLARIRTLIDKKNALL